MLSFEDKIFIKNLWECKSLHARRGWTFWAHTLKTVHLDSFLPLMALSI